jgi:2'-5' RNA ligase
VDHVVIPLDRGHVASVDELARAVAEAAGLTWEARTSNPHITVLAYRGGPADHLADFIAPVVAGAAPFTVHAHGYGFFTGSEPSDLSLHVPVVRSGPLDALHSALWLELGRAGAEIAGWSQPGVWSPHVTLLDRLLDPDGLARAVAWLAQRPHPSWSLDVDRIVLTGGGTERHHADVVLPFGGRTT